MILVRARSVTLGEEAYVEHAYGEHRAAPSASWRPACGALADRLGCPGVVADHRSFAIGDPVAFTDAFIGAMAAGFWVALLDPSMPWGGSGGLAATARAARDAVVAVAPRRGRRWARCGLNCTVSNTLAKGR